MKLSLLEWLRCPECRGVLALVPAQEPLTDTTAIDDGSLRCVGCARSYPIVRGIPRFVGDGNYTGSFGYQWTKFSRTQLDEHLGVPLSAERFEGETRWPRSLTGQKVLEAGSGMGRFTRCAAATGA